MKNLNKDIVKRDKMIFGGYDQSKYYGGVRRFKNLTLATLKLLVKENFADGAEHQNSAPTTAEILDFMTKYSGYTAHGYAVDVERGDYRVTLEGVSKDSAADSFEEWQDFHSLFEHADNFYADEEMYCWFT